MEQIKSFDFEKNKVIGMEFETLKRTYKENDILGRPLKGMYHYDVIDAITDTLDKKNVNYQIREIFAAQSQDKRIPSVVINPAIEEQYGEKAVEAHVLRRVYADINISDYDNEELTTNVVMAFHQDAIQIAYGPQVKICHNQCILSPERVLTTGRGSSIFDIINKFGQYMDTLGMAIQEDKAYIERMREKVLTPGEILATIGTFTTMRVAHDTKIDKIRSREYYPLNQAQISKFTEDLLIEQTKKDYITLWDLYNVATNLYKVQNMQIPSMFDQHLALNEFVHTMI